MVRRHKWQKGSSIVGDVALCPSVVERDFHISWYVPIGPYPPRRSSDLCTNLLKVHLDLKVSLGRHAKEFGAILGVDQMAMDFNRPQIAVHLNYLGLRWF